MKLGDTSSLLKAQGSLIQTNKALARAVERIATGRRINDAKDDTAGLARSNNLESQIRALARGTLNINDSAAQTRTLSAGLDELRAMVGRMRELAVQSANGVINSIDRENLNEEFQELQSEVTRILTDGAWKAQNAKGSYAIQAGSNSLHKLWLNMPALRPATLFADETEDYRGIGTFTLTQTINIGASFSRASGAFAEHDTDVNDFAVSISSLNQVNVYTNNGSGVFSQTATLTGAASSTYSMSYDYNGDGLNDIMIYKGSAGTVQVYTANGDGTFALTHNATLAAFSSVRNYQDLTGDDMKDLIVLNTSSANIFIADGEGSFDQTATLNHGLSSASVFMDYDFNGDAIDDLLFYNTTGGGTAAYLSDGEGGYTTAGTISLAASFTPFPRDLNGDGTYDILSMDITTGVANAYINDGNGQFTLTSTISSGANTNYLTGDFNGDDYDDIIAADSTANYSTIYLNNGNGTFASSGTFDETSITSLTDITGDGISDIVSISTAGIEVYVGDGHGDAVNTTSLSHGISGSNSSGVGSGYTLGYSGRSTTGEYLIYKHQGSGVFTEVLHTNIATATTSRGLTDLNGDGLEDFYMATATSIYSWFQEANGTFTARPTLSTTAASSSLVTNHDYSGDDVKDYFANSSANIISIYKHDSRISTEIDETPLSISTQAEAEEVLSRLDETLQSLASTSADLGALQNRLDIAASMNLLNEENLNAARSRIVDVDYVEGVTDLVREQILQESGIDAISAAFKQSQLQLALLLSLKTVK